MDGRENASLCSLRQLASNNYGSMYLNLEAIVATPRGLVIIIYVNDSRKSVTCD